MRSLFCLSVTLPYRRARSHSSPPPIWYQRTCCLRLLRGVWDLWFLRTSTNKLFEASPSRSDNFADCVFLCPRGAEHLAESTSQSAEQLWVQCPPKEHFKTSTSDGRIAAAAVVWPLQPEVLHVAFSDVDIYHRKIDRCKIWLLQTNEGCRSDASVTGSFIGRADWNWN